MRNAALAKVNTSACNSCLNQVISFASLVVACAKKDLCCLKCYREPSISTGVLHGSKQPANDTKITVDSFASVEGPTLYLEVEESMRSSIWRDVIIHSTFETIFVIGLGNTCNDRDLVASRFYSES